MSNPLGQTVNVAGVGEVGGLDAFSRLVNFDIYSGKDALVAEKKLIGEGLGKTALFQDLAASGDVQTLQELADLGRRQAMVYVREYAQRNQIAQQVGPVAGQSVYGQQLADQKELVASVRDQMKHQNELLREEIRVLKSLAGHVHDGVAEGVNHGLAAAASGANHKVKNHPHRGTGERVTAAVPRLPQCGNDRAQR